MQRRDGEQSAVQATVIVIDRAELKALVREAVREELAGQNADRAEYLNAGELAELLGVARSSIPQLVKREGLPTIRLGRAYRFHRAEVIVWLKARAARSGNHVTKHISSLARLKAGT